MKWYLKQTVRIQSSAEASGTSVQWIVVSQDIMIFSVDLNHYAWKLNQLKNGIQTISMHLIIFIYILLEVCSASVVFFWTSEKPELLVQVTTTLLTWISTDIHNIHDVQRLRYQKVAKHWLYALIHKTINSISINKDYFVKFGS